MAMTTHERMTRMYEHREADRVPITDSAWASTVARWRREGLPSAVSYHDYFGLDRLVGINVDNSPRYPIETLEETADYAITTTQWGATLKNWRHTGGVPEFLDFRIKDWASWEAAKARMRPSRDRIDWELLAQHYERWRAEGAWLTARFWFGYDATHSFMVGTAPVLMAMLDDPDWVRDMIDTCLEMDIALFDMLWEAGYRFDEVRWPDDMGYKYHTFFSLDTYRQIVRPAHQRAADWAHAHGMKVRLHSCGYVEPFIPDLIEIGIDMLNPLEVKAGMDPVKLKRTYGDRLAFHGGLNAVLYTEPGALWAEMERVIPVMKENGGYLISSDHSVPEVVSLAQFERFVSLAKALGRYD